MFYSYAGNDAKKRPEHMQKTNRVLDGDKDIPTLEFYIEKLTEYIDEYNNIAHHSNVQQHIHQQRWETYSVL